MLISNPLSKCSSCPLIFYPSRKTGCHELYKNTSLFHQSGALEGQRQYNRWLDDIYSNMNYKTVLTLCIYLYYYKWSQIDITYQWSLFQVSFQCFYSLNYFKIVLFAKKKSMQNICSQYIWNLSFEIEVGPGWLNELGSWIT